MSSVSFLSSRGLQSSSLINVREARKEDMDEVYEMLLGLMAYRRVDYKAVEKDVFLRQSGFFLPNDKSYFHVFVAEQSAEKKLLGYSMDYFMYKSSYQGLILYIEDLFVKESLRGTSVGRLLMQSQAKRAKDHSCTSIRLMCRDWNPAVKFYERIHGRWTGVKVGPLMEFEWDQKAMDTLIEGEK